MNTFRYLAIRAICGAWLKALQDLEPEPPTVSEAALRAMLNIGGNATTEDEAEHAVEAILIWLDMGDPEHGDLFRAKLNHFEALFSGKESPQ